MLSTSELGPTLALIAPSPLSHNIVSSTLRHELDSNSPYLPPGDLPSSYVGLSAEDLH